jgi:hypothetical protein
MDHIIVQVSEDSSSEILNAIISGVRGVKEAYIVRGMPEDHKGFRNVLCHKCYQYWVPPGDPVCEPCKRSYGGMI